MTDGNGREPGGWELLRAVQSINTRLDDLAKGFVSVAVHNLLADRVKDLEADVSKETAARETAVKDANAAREKLAAELRAAEAEQRKSRGQTWTAIGLAGVAVVFGIFGAFIRQGLGLP